MKTRAVFVIVRDTALLLAGIFGVLFQQVTGHISIPLLMVYLGMIGTPGTIGIAHLLRGKPEAPGTAESPSPSHSESL